MWHVIFSIVLALLFLLTGAGKVLGLAFANQNRDRLGVHPSFWRVTGLLEWAGAVGLIAGIWWWPIGLAAACGLALLMLGAIASRVRAHRMHPGPGRAFALTVTGDAVVLVLAVVTAVLIARGV
jgi:uncharacterized membrane protein YphA (DoxX/SURF4 family)